MKTTPARTSLSWGKLLSSIMSQQTRQKKGKQLPKSHYGHQPKYQKPHLIIPAEDLAWALQQKPSVNQFWQECWLADPYGSRWMQLGTTLKERTFRSARKVLTGAGLFIFKRDTSIRDSRETVCWMEMNLHGSRTDFWSKEDGTQMPKSGTQMPDIGTQMPKSGTQMPDIGIQMPDSSPQTTQNQGFLQASVTSQKHFSISLSIPEGEREREKTELITEAIAVEQSSNVLAENRTVDPSSNVLAKNRTDEPSSNVLAENRTDDPSSNVLAKNRTDDPSSKVLAEDQIDASTRKVASEQSSSHCLVQQKDFVEDKISAEPVRQVEVGLKHETVRQVEALPKHETVRQVEVARKYDAALAINPQSAQKNLDSASF